MTALIDSKGPLGPTPERLWQGTVQRLQATVRDSEGGIGHPWRGLDTLSAMLARGSITSKMRQAGDRFHDLFRAASLDGLYSADLNRVPVQLNTSRMWLNGGGNEAARLSVLSGLDALGGMRSPGGSCAWHVLGCEIALKTWALSCGWAGRRVDKAIAAGILIADLGILKEHYLL